MLRDVTLCRLPAAAIRHGDWNPRQPGENEMLYEVRLELAHCREFPGGNTACGYELVLPLTSDGRLDYRAWLQHRHGNGVCRVWPKEEWRGQLKHDRHGWFFVFGHGEASDEAILRCDDDRFIAGEWIQIAEFDGQTGFFGLSKSTQGHTSRRTSDSRDQPFIFFGDRQAPSRVGGAKSAIPSR